MITFVSVNYKVACGCRDPWNNHTTGFRWETNGGDLRHLCEEEANGSDTNVPFT
jgi:hypothetical protein